MKTAIAVLLVSSLAFADPPKRYSAGDGCNTCTDLGNGYAECTLLACGQTMPALVRELPRDEVVVPGAGGDAPLANPDAVGRSLILEQGSITPYAGVLLDEQEAVRRERARVRAEETLRKAEEGVLLPRGALIAIIAGCAAASAAVAAGVTVWALKK